MLRKPCMFLTFCLFACLLTPGMAQDGLPLKEHEMLKMDDGVWEAKITMLGEPGTEPTVVIAKETNEMVGELWSIGKLEGKFGEMDYVGYATLGYDPLQKKYVGTYIDSVTPEITQMSGTYEPKTKTLILFYEISLGDGKKQKRKNIMVYEDHNTRDFKMYIREGSDWSLSMKIDYKRLK